MLSTGTGFGETRIVGELSDANGWGHRTNYATLRVGDVDGDGGEDLCARGDAEMGCWRWDGAAFVFRAGWVRRAARPSSTTLWHRVVRRGAPAPDALARGAPGSCRERLARARCGQGGRFCRGPFACMLGRMLHSRLAWSLLVLTACSPSPGMSGAPACSDGLLDRDSVIDCEDPACASLPACSPKDASTPVPSIPDGGMLPDRNLQPSAPCVAPMDVVFVIDVSTSMADEVAGIREGIDSIWAATEARSIDARFGVVVFVDDVAAVNGCAPFDSVSALQSELMSWQRFTSSNGQPGGSSASNSDCAENSLDAIYTAATTCTWRPEATRLLIHVTDDTFAERPTRLSGRIAVEHTYAETLEALVSREVRVGAFAAPGAGEYCGAGTSPDVGRGFHAPYMGMPSLTEATGGRAWSIRDVRAGTLDMAEAIIEFAQDEHCAPF